MQEAPAVSALYLPLALDTDLRARSFAPAAPREDIVGQLGGAVTAVAADDRRVYVGVGPRVQVFDAHDIVFAAPLGQSDVLPGIVESLLLTDGSLFAVAGGGLHRLDVAASDSPTASAVIEGGVRGDIAGDGRRLAVAATRGDGRAGTDWWSLRILVTLDLGEPGAPPTIQTLDLGAHAVALEMNGTHVFVATDLLAQPGGSMALVVVDVGGPGPAHAVAQLPLVSSGTLDIARNGGTLYVSDHEGVAVVDVRLPAAPRVLRRIEHPSSRLAVDTDTLAVDDLDGIHLYRVVDPAEPARVGTLAGPLSLFALDRQWLFAGRGGEVSGREAELVRALIDPDGQPTEVARLRLPPSRATNVAIGDGVAIAIDRYRSVSVVDVGSSGLPGSVRTWEKDISSATSYLGHLYIMGDDGLEVWDLARPVETGPVAHIEGCCRQPEARLVTDSGRLYVCEFGDLAILDVSVPSQPTIKSVTRGRFRWCAVDGPVLAATDPGAAPGVQLVDVSNAEQPSPLEFVPITEAFAVGPVAVRDGLLAVITAELDYPDLRTVLRLMDVSAPSDPRFVGNVTLGGLTVMSNLLDDNRISRVDLLGGIAYVNEPTMDNALGHGRIFYVDVRDPSRPRLAAVQPTLGEALAAAAVGRRTYVADGAAGLVVLEWPEEVPGP